MFDCSRFVFMRFVLPALMVSASIAEAQTRFVVNGEALDSQTIAALEQAYQTGLEPGRYWINAVGVGGFEGGPPVFDLRVLAARRGSGGRAWSHSGPGGHMGSDGNCSYYFDPQSGSSVMTGNCN